MTTYDEITLKPIKTGWLVSISGETVTTTEAGHKDTDYINEEYAFTTMPEALTKITDLSTQLTQ